MHDGKPTKADVANGLQLAGYNPVEADKLAHETVEPLRLYEKFEA